MPDLEVARAAVEEALEAAGAIGEEEARGTALAVMGEPLAMLDPDRATALALSRAASGALEEDEESAGDEALLHVAEGLARADTQRALEFVREHPEALSVAAGAARVAEAMAPGDPGRTILLLRAVEDVEERAFAVEQAAASLAPTHSDELLEVARDLGGDFHRPLALLAIAVAWAPTDPSRAQALAEEAVAATWAGDSLEAVLGDDFDGRRVGRRAGRARALAEIADRMTPTHPEWARRVLEEALAAAQVAQEELGGGEDTLGDVAQALARVDPEQAATIARGLEDPYDRADAIARAAQRVAPSRPELARELVAEALADLPRIEDPGSRNRAFEYAATAVAIYDPKAALDLVLDPPAGAHSTFGLLVGETVAAEVPDYLWEVARRTEDEGVRAECLEWLASVRGEEWAERLLPEVPGLTDPDLQDDVLSSLSEGLAKTDPRRSLGLARRVQDPQDRVFALYEVAMRALGVGL